MSAGDPGARSHSAAAASGAGDDTAAGSVAESPGARSYSAAAALGDDTAAGSVAESPGAGAGAESAASASGVTSLWAAGYHVIVIHIC